MKKTVITIARSYGSGGRTLGKLLAEELGINCYDREILRMASDDSGINEALFGQTDEKLKKSPLFRIARKNPYKGGVIPPESADFVSDDNLFNYQAKVIRELAEEESCIIIGRCADYVLKDDPNVLRLFFFAPKEDCIVRVMEHDGITGRDAENKIEKIDKHRADYYKYYTGKDWYDARNYDFCLDTTSMGYEKLVEVVKEVPLEQLVLETDSPYLTPVPNRGKRNDSRQLTHVVDAIAQIKGISREEVIRVTEQNARRMYRIRG